MILNYQIIQPFKKNKVKSSVKIIKQEVKIKQNIIHQIYNAIVNINNHNIIQYNNKIIIKIFHQKVKFKPLN